MRLKRNVREADHADELAGCPQFGRPESESVLGHVRLNALDHRVALFGCKACRKELHHAWIGIHPAEWFAIALLPRAQQQTGCFQHGYFIHGAAWEQNAGAVPMGVLSPARK
jgi:hypothetical protein